MTEHRPILTETPCDPLPAERPAPRRLQVVAALGVSLVGAASLSTAVFQTITGASTTVGLPDDDRSPDSGWSWDLTDGADGGAPLAAPPVLPPAPAITPTVADLDLRAAENPLAPGVKVGAPAVWAPLAGVAAPVRPPDVPVAAPWTAAPPVGVPVSAPEPTRTSSAPAPEPTPSPAPAPAPAPAPEPTPTETSTEAPPTTRSEEETSTTTTTMPAPTSEPVETPEPSEAPATA